MNRNYFYAAMAALIFTTGCSTVKKTANPVDDRVTPQQFSDNQVKISEKTLDGKWFIYSVNGKSISSDDEEEWPTIQFSAAENRIYGYNGCNYINGSYSVRPGQNLTIGNLLSTQKYCHDVKYEQDINKAIADARSYSMITGVNELTLNLHNAKGLTVMTLKRSAIDFLNGAWQVTAIEGKSTHNPDIRLIIDIPEKRIHGNTGCNILNGNLSQDPNIPMSIQFMSLATTRMACNDGGTERDLLIALEEVVTAKAGKHGTAQLIDKKGKTLITLKQLSREEL